MNNQKSRTKQLEFSELILNVMKIKEPIIRDIENVGFERYDIERIFYKVITKGVDGMSTKEIKKTIICELTKVRRSKTPKNPKPSKEQMLQAITG